MRLRGFGGVRAVRAGMGWGGFLGEKLGGTRRNSEGMGGVRVFFGGGGSDGSCGRRWELWGLEKKRGWWDWVVMEVWELCGRIGN